MNDNTAVYYLDKNLNFIVVKDCNENVAYLIKKNFGYLVCNVYNDNIRFNDLIMGGNEMKIINIPSNIVKMIKLDINLAYDIIANYIKNYDER